MSITFIVIDFISPNSCQTWSKICKTHYGPVDSLRDKSKIFLFVFPRNFGPYGPSISMNLWTSSLLYVYDNYLYGGVKRPESTSRMRVDSWSFNSDIGAVYHIYIQRGDSTKRIHRY